MDPQSAAGDSVADQPAPSAHLSRTLSGFLAARIELASIEAKEAASFTGKKIIYGLALGISVFFVWLLLLTAITGILAPMVDAWLDGKADWLPGWAAVVSALALIHALAAIILFIKHKQQPATPLFELSRKELENDKLWLKKNK
jgi:uncharacterized membrane protein YqjE